MTPDILTVPDICRHGSIRGLTSTFVRKSGNALKLRTLSRIAENSNQGVGIDLYIDMGVYVVMCISLSSRHYSWSRAVLSLSGSCREGVGNDMNYLV